MSEGGESAGDDDRAVFAQEVAALAGRVELLVAHLASASLRRRMDVQDLAQDVIVSVLSSDTAHGLRGQELWRFTMAVARSIVIDAARRLRHAPRRSASVAPGAGLGSGSAASIVSARAASGPGPRTLAAGAEDQDRLLAAFDALTPEHRRVIGLRRFEGLSARETAERMGRGEAAVHSLFRRALAAWSDALAGPPSADPAGPRSPGSD